MEQGLHEAHPDSDNPDRPLHPRVSLLPVCLRAAAKLIRDALRDLVGGRDATHLSEQLVHLLPQKLRLEFQRRGDSSQAMGAFSKRLDPALGCI